jgi:hypothetical protein
MMATMHVPVEASRIFGNTTRLSASVAFTTVLRILSHLHGRFASEIVLLLTQ